jgi:HipA-like kinase
MPVLARQHIQRMRGGANSHLMLAGSDYYVVKFRNNPQHPRVLVNELICYVLLEYLQLPVPRWEIVEVPRELVETVPELVMEVGRTLRRCEPGLHFGSRYPVDPLRQAVYDYLPVSLLRTVLNADSFCGMLAFDKWVSNANGRQAVFFRDRAGRWLPAVGSRSTVSPRSLVYVAAMIDHGFAFEAQNWSFSDSPERGLYSRREVYERVNGFGAFEPWLDRIRNCSSDVLDDVYKKVPPEWHGGDWDALEALLEQLHRRRGRVPDLVRDAKKAGRDPFPNWSTAATAVGR